MKTRCSTTRLSRTFCSARDRDIPVLVRVGHPDPEDADPTLLGCLDYGVRCTGWLCPLFSLPTLPPEGLLEEAIQAERTRQAMATGSGRAILERALKEGRATRAEQRARREAARRRKEAKPLPDAQGRA